MELTFENSINPTNYTFNYSVLQQYNAQELALWFKSNYSQIQNHLLSRFRFLLNENPSIMYQPTKERYLSKAVEAIRNIDADNPRFLPYVHFIALFGMRSSTSSCHEVLFGEHKPVILRGQTLALLDMYAHASTEIQTQLVSKLAAYPSTVTNPVFTSFHRYSDLAEENGLPVNQWLSKFYGRADLFEYIASFKEETFLPQDELLSYQSTAKGLSSMWWLALLFAPQADVSLDYLFLENYCRLAKHPDRELTDNDRVFLSFYLSASRYGQTSSKYHFLLNHC